MVTKERIFDGKKYTFGGEFDYKYQAENAVDRLMSKSPFIYTRIMRIKSHAPPQGDVFYRLYYRYYSPEGKRGLIR